MRWWHLLQEYQFPDQLGAYQLVHDMITGFRIGYSGDRSSFRDAPNLPIPSDQEFHVDDDMKKELEGGRRAGPFCRNTIPFDNLKVSPIGIVDKKNSSKKRIIHHLSWPRDRSDSSINFSIEENDTILQSFDDAIDIIVSAHRGSSTGVYLSKVDVQAAYRVVPVHPSDWHLLGIKWRGSYYFEKVLPFGLKSSCFHWERVATTAHWLASKVLSTDRLVHYIDDFLIVSPTQRMGELQVTALLTLFKQLGIPISPEKLEGPTTIIIFLGILINTVDMTISLDADRLQRILATLSNWMNKSTASIEELESISGVLGFASKVIRAGRTFLRRLINYTTYLNAKHRNRTMQFKLNQIVKQDLKWWLRYIEHWNGKHSLYPTDWTSSQDMKIFTDASKVGYGATFNREWFFGEWTENDHLAAARQSRDSMPWKECKALVLAAATWGHHWAQRNIILHIDCAPVVNALNKGDSGEPGIMALIRSLSFIAATHNFQYKITHIPGITNVAADLLSRLQVPEFRTRFPNSSPSPTPVLPIPAHDW
jgi:hypothetical protein